MKGKLLRGLRRNRKKFRIFFILEKKKNYLKAVFKFKRYIFVFLIDICLM